MYILISDRFALEDEREYYYCSGKYLEEAKQYFPDICELTEESIDEILTYSGRRLDSIKPVKIAKCTGLEIDDVYVRVDYGELKGSENNLV